MVKSLKNILFQKKENLDQKNDIFEIIASIISQELSIKVNAKNIKIQKNIIYIQESPLIRQEIFSHKEILLNKIKKHIPYIRDIK
ncbi:MAG: hypothetical protein ACI9AR_000224 [Flavobacteriaceae bacterium]|jgi:hypothetical protein